MLVNEDTSSLVKLVASFMVDFVFQVLCFVKDEEQWGYVQSLFEKVARTFRKQVNRFCLLFERFIHGVHLYFRLRDKLVFLCYLFKTLLSL